MAKAAKAAKAARAPRAKKPTAGGEAEAFLAEVVVKLNRIERKLDQHLQHAQLLMLEQVATTLEELEGVAVQGMSDEQRGHWDGVRERLKALMDPRGA